MTGLSTIALADAGSGKLLAYVIGLKVMIVKVFQLRNIREAHISVAFPIKLRLVLGVTVVISPAVPATA